MGNEVAYGYYKISLPKPLYNVEFRIDSQSISKYVFKTNAFDIRPDVHMCKTSNRFVLLSGIVSYLFRLVFKLQHVHFRHYLCVH